MKDRGFLNESLILKNERLIFKNESSTMDIVSIRDSFLNYVCQTDNRLCIRYYIYTYIYEYEIFSRLEIRSVFSSTPLSSQDIVRAIDYIIYRSLPTYP